MRIVLELQTGQVALVSGLMSGFALSVAAHVLRYGVRSRVAQVVFVLLLASSLLFIMALYVDARLSIELAGRTSLTPSLARELVDIRFIGTTGATVGFFIFIVSIGLLGWLATPMLGVISTSMSFGVLYLLITVWVDIGVLSSHLSS